jgi:hypothetical protein
VIEDHYQDEDLDDPGSPSEQFARICLLIGALLLVAFAACAIAGWGIR